jgi:hypothetical protein
LAATGVSVVVIGPDSAEAMRRQNLPCPVIADPEGRLLARLGQENRWYRLGRLPALLAVAPGGTVVWRHFGQSMSDLPSLDEAIDRLTPEGAKPPHP